MAHRRVPFRLHVSLHATCVLLFANAYGGAIPNGTLILIVLAPRHHRCGAFLIVVIVSLILIVLAPRHHRFIKVQQASRTLQFCLYALLGLSSRYAATTELSVPSPQMARHFVELNQLNK